jgi:hypothetical protein
MKKLLSLMLFITGCQQCYPAFTSNYTSYTVTTIRTNTKYDYGIDDPNNELNDTVVESIISKTVDCLKQVHLTAAELGQAECFGDKDISIHGCLTIKVAPNWMYSCRDPHTEVFPCNVPNASCTVKGLTPTPSCPCSCRAIIQDNATIVTVPDLSTGVFSAQLGTLLTGCTNVWAVPKLNACIFKE